MLIEKYNPNWEKQFKEIKNILNISLQNIQYTIEHIGSTSVPYLDSKPIIDIDIIYYNQKTFQKIKSNLEKIGYFHNGDQGIDGREVFKRNNLLNNSVLDTIKHHLYVCKEGNKALERHILSRNFLRKNEWAKSKYQFLKYQLAKKANQNKKKYAELKELYVNEFLDSIIEKEKNNTAISCSIF